MTGLPDIQPMTHTHPDADAFMRRILSNPTDALPRLVFADWLEESGTSSNLAWARYLRLADELANAPPDDTRRPKMVAELQKIGSLIRAKLTCRAEVFVAYPDAMLQLLPAHCLVAKLDTVMPPLVLLELVPESIVRENQVLPLAELSNRTLLCAATASMHRHLDELLQFVLNRSVAFVDVTDADLTPCLDRNYGLWDVETVDSVLYQWLPDDGLRGGPLELAHDPTVAFWNHVILDARLYTVTAVQVEYEASQLTVWHCTHEGRRRHELYALPLSEETIVRLVPVLRLFLHNTVETAEGATSGEITVLFWGRPRTHTVQITERPNGFTVQISIPPYPLSPSVALNPAA